MPFIREHTHVCHPERTRGISQMLVEHAKQVGSNSRICEMPRRLRDSG